VSLLAAAVASPLALPFAIAGIALALADIPFSCRDGFDRDCLISIALGQLGFASFSLALVLGAIEAYESLALVLAFIDYAVNVVAFSSALQSGC
jgi:hypothetical protein